MAGDLVLSVIVNDSMQTLGQIGSFVLGILFLLSLKHFAFYVCVRVSDMPYMLNFLQCK